MSNGHHGQIDSPKPVKKSGGIGGKLVTILVILAVIGGIGWKLSANKAAKAKVVAAPPLKEVPVTVASAQRQNLQQALSLVGSVAASSDVMVASETSGRIVAVGFQAGDRVGAGQLLYRVDDELRQAALLQAEANYEKAKKDFERMETLVKEKAVPEQNLDAARLGYKSAEAQLITARRQLKDTRITAPVSGVAVSRNFDVGASVNPGTPVTNIVDISTVKVKVNVAERDAFSMKVGEKVQVSTDVYPGATFQGTIRSIGAKGDEAHTYPVEVALANNSERPLRAGMFARVNFAAISSGEVVTVPREAIVGSIKDAQVYVVENGVANLRRIVVGNEGNGVFEVRQGLSAGETVVVNGQNNLTTGTQVKIVK